MEGTWVGKARLLRNLVVAGFAAVFAVVQAVFPEPYIQLALAESAVLLTVAALFDLFALAAAGFSLGCHRQTLALEWSRWKRAVGNLEDLSITGGHRGAQGLPCHPERSRGTLRSRAKPPIHASILTARPSPSFSLCPQRVLAIKFVPLFHVFCMR